MMRMEIALILVLLFIAFIYFSAGKRNTPLHKTFSALLIITPLHLAFDAATIYTVNHMETVAPFLNEILHRLFIASMLIVVYLFYRYIAILVEEEIMIREGFKCLFDWEAHDCEVVGEAADGMEALGQIDALLPDIVIWI